MIRKSFLPILFLALFFSPAFAATQDQTVNYNKEQLKQDYRAFLQQLKTLNAQYKEITGEFGQIVKEEGVPSWDMGDGVKNLNGEKKEESASQDLGGGASFKENDKNMELALDLPGYKKDSIKLSFLDGKKLMVNANRKIDSKAKSYERSFDLPVPGDQKTTTATYEDGVLSVKIPKVASKEVSIPIR